MRVAVVEDTANHQQYRDVLRSFAKGCGGDITNSGNTNGYDCAVIFGSYKKERGRPAHHGKGKIIESGMPYVQLETQLIGRPIDTAFHTEFRVGVNGFLWDDARWGFEHIEGDRSTKVFERNGYDPNVPWRQDGDYILLCMQKVGDASLMRWSAHPAGSLRVHGLWFAPRRPSVPVRRSDPRCHGLPDASALGTQVYQPPGQDYRPECAILWFILAPKAHSQTRSITRCSQRLAAYKLCGAPCFYDAALSNPRSLL